MKRVSQVSIAEISSIEKSLQQFSIPQVSINQEGIFKIGLVQSSPFKIGISKNSPSSISSIEDSISQVGTTEISGNQNCLIQSSPFQVGITQVSTSQVRPIQRGSAEISIPDVSRSEGNIIKASIPEVSTTKIDTFWELQSCQHKSTEIPFPSSITLQQLLRSYPHLYTSALINTYKDNPLNLWQSLFDPTFNIDLQIANNGTYTAFLTVTDSDGGVNTDTITVTVNNIAPTINTINGDITVNEGATANFSATATDLRNDTLTYTWNFGNGSNPVDGKDVSHIFADNDAYTVTLTVTDSDGAATVQTLNVKVNNVVPIVNAGTESTANEGQTITFLSAYTDPIKTIQPEKGENSRMTLIKLLNE